jgi:hypothetical protein
VTSFHMDHTEVMITDPKTGAKKGSKPARFDLIPHDALWTLAEHYGHNCSKYPPRNWEKGNAWSLHYASLTRHIAAWWMGEDVDPKSEHGALHLTAVAWHAIALLAYQLRGIGTDDRAKIL